MKILVTGGAGFIGSNFVRHVLATHPDDSVVNLDKLTYAGNPAEPRATSRRDPAIASSRATSATAPIVRDVMAGVDAVVHFAAETHVDRSQPGRRRRSSAPTSTGTFTLLEAARELKIGRFLRSSTDEVYGSVARRARRARGDPLNPSNPYSASKAAADLLARAYWITHRLPVVVTRSSNNFGPYQYPEKVIPLFVTNALEDRPLPLYGDGTNVRDWLYVLDNCAAIDLVLRKGKDGEIYNIGGGNEVRERRAHAPDPAPARQAGEPDHAGGGPARARPPLRARLRARSHALGWTPAPSVSTTRWRRRWSGTARTRRGGGPSSRASSAPTTSGSTPRGERACGARRPLVGRSRCSLLLVPPRACAAPRRARPAPATRAGRRAPLATSAASSRRWWGSGWRSRRTRPRRPRSGAERCGQRR